MDKNINIPSSEFGPNDKIPVSISFSFHDLEDIGDGDESEVFWISKEDYLKIENYYANPYGHYIGIMINFEMPGLKKMVEEKVRYWAKDIFITDVICNEELLECCFAIDDNKEFEDYANFLIDGYIDYDLERSELCKIVRETIDVLIDVSPKTDDYVYIDEDLLLAWVDIRIKQDYPQLIKSNPDIPIDDELPW